MNKDCPKCGQPAKEVIHAEQQRRKGWYCPACQHFDPAIGRERLLDRHSSRD